MIKVIYIYTDGTPCQYKIGKAERDRKEALQVALERIREQLVASFRGNINILSIINVTDSPLSSLDIEGRVHKELDKTYERISRSITYQGEVLFDSSNTEWFAINNKEEFEVVDMVQTIIKKVTGVQVKPEFIPRFYQEYMAVEMLDAIDKLIDKDQKEIKIGLELCPRFGKTVFALGSVFKTMFDAGLCKVLVLPSHWLSSHTSFEKEAKRYSDFDSFVYIKRGEQEAEKIVKQNLGKNPIVIEVSLYKDETDLDKISHIREIPKEDKLSIIDEADFGAHTEKSRNVISYIDSKYEIYMTGTNIQRALCGITPDLILQFSYEEMLLIKKGIHPIQDKLVA
jgi:hypothetical protein